MLTHATPVAFVGVADLDVAHAFYADILGLPLADERPFALSAPGLRVTQVDTPVAAPYTVLGFEVADLGGTVAELAGRGVDFRRYEGVDQDDRGVWTAPDGRQIAWFADPDGNVLSVAGA